MQISRQTLEDFSARLLALDALAARPPHTRTVPARRVCRSGTGPTLPPQRRHASATQGWSR